MSSLWNLCSNSLTNVGTCLLIWERVWNDETKSLLYFIILTSDASSGHFRVHSSDSHQFLVHVVQVIEILHNLKYQYAIFSSSPVLLIRSKHSSNLVPYAWNATKCSQQRVSFLFLRSFLPLWHLLALLPLILSRDPSCIKFQQQRGYYSPSRSPDRRALLFTLQELERLQ